MRSPKCKLCSVKNKSMDSELFFIVNCKKHFKPIVILKEHVKEISQDLQNKIETELKNRFPRCRFDYSIKDSDEHWHIHLDGVMIA